MVAAGRRQRKNAIGTDLIIEMSFGTEQDVNKPLPTTMVSAASVGLDQKTVRRARGLTLNALSVKSHERTEAKKRTSRIRCVKASWDETALRMWLPAETCRKLFPGFDFPDPPKAPPMISRRLRGKRPPAIAQDPNVLKKKGKVSRPSYVVQIMQSAGNILLKDCVDDQGLSAPLISTPRILPSTSAFDLFSGVRAGFHDDNACMQGEGTESLLLYADSLTSNKVVVANIAYSNPETPVADIACYGHQCSLVGDDISKPPYSIKNELYAAKKLWHNPSAREEFLKEVDRYTEEAATHSSTSNISTTRSSSGSRGSSSSPNSDTLGVLTGC